MEVTVKIKIVVSKSFRGFEVFLLFISFTGESFEVLEAEFLVSGGHVFMFRPLHLHDHYLSAKVA